MKGFKQFGKRRDEDYRTPDLSENEKSISNSSNQPYSEDESRPSLELMSQSHGTEQSLSKRKHSNNDIDENTILHDEKQQKEPESIETHDWQSWLVVFGSFCGATVVFGIMDAMGAIETYLSTHQLDDVATSTVGWIFSIYIILSFGFIFLTGEIFDKLGPTVPMIVGTVLMFAGLIATANCTEIYQFILAFSVTCGMASAIMLAPLISVIPQYFDRRISLVSGLVSTGASIGGGVFPIMLRRLYTSIGYVWAMRIFAFLNFGLLVLACLFVKARSAAVIPEEYKRMSLIQKIADCCTRSLDFKAFLEPMFSLVTCGALFAEASIVMCTTYYASFCIQKGASENTAYLMLTILNLVGIPARWATGVAADRFGKFNIMIFMVFLTAFLMIVLLYPFSNHLGVLYGFAVGFGISCCSVFTLTPVCLAQITPVEHFGKRYGTMYFVATVGNFFIPIAGAVIGQHNRDVGFSNYVILCAVVSFTGGLFWLAARYLAVRTRWVAY